MGLTMKGAARRGVLLRGKRSAASRAARDAETPSETYYPREWFSQKETTELSLFENVKEWRGEKGKHAPGMRTTDAARHALYWRMEQMMRQQEKHRNEEVGMFFLPYLDWGVRDGCKPFLSPTHAHRLYTDLHRFHVDELTRLTSGTNAEAAPLDVLVDATSFDATQYLVNFHASMHWNMLFCWKSIVPYGSVDMPVRTRREIWKYCHKEADVDAIEQLKADFEETAMNLVGNGFVWLVWNTTQQVLEVRTTDHHTCPTVLKLIPVLGLNLWDNAISPGYGMNKLDYVKRFWHCIDWTWADYCIGLIQEDKELLYEADISDDQAFPTQVSQREDQMIKSFARRTREEPLARATRDWESWRRMRIQQDPGIFGPGTHMASRQDQETELLWRAGQQYHIVHAHCHFSRPPPPTHLASWTMTRRWFNQLQAKHILESTAVFPPASGILWPEEAHEQLVQGETEDQDEVPEWEEESPQPWREMRERWFHTNTHKKELDFWRERYNITWQKHGLYYGVKISEG